MHDFAIYSPTQIVLMDCMFIYEFEEQRVEGWNGERCGGFCILDSIRRITNLRIIGFQGLQFFLMHNKTHKLKKLVGFLKLYFLLLSLNILITLHPNYVLYLVQTCKALALRTNGCDWKLVQVIWILSAIWTTFSTLVSGNTIVQVINDT